MQHIDRKLLYTDRTYRFDYVTDFLEFGAKDLEAIRKIREPLLELVPAIVDAVYDKLFSYDITKGLFMMPLVTDYKGEYPLDLETFDLSHPLMTKRKDHLGRYLRMLISGDIGDNLLVYFDAVARIHNGYSRSDNAKATGGKWPKDRLHIDYCHIGALSGWLNSFVASALIDSALPRNQVEAAVAAFTRILWLQNDFFAKYYVTMDYQEESVDGEAIPESTAKAAPASTAPTSKPAADGGGGFGAGTLAAVGAGCLLAGMVLTSLLRR